MRLTNHSHRTRNSSGFQPVTYQFYLLEFDKFTHHITSEIVYVVYSNLFLYIYQNVIAQLFDFNEK